MPLSERQEAKQHIVRSEKAERQNARITTADCAPHQLDRTLAAVQSLTGGTLLQMTQ